MDDQLSELLKSLKAAQDILSAESREKTAPAEVEGGGKAADHEPERKVSLGDVTRQRKDYEREPFDRK